LPTVWGTRSTRLRDSSAAANRSSWSPSRSRAMCSACCWCAPARPPETPCGVVYTIPYHTIPYHTIPLRTTPRRWAQA
jgi:hypothetical protein